MVDRGVTSFCIQIKMKLRSFNSSKHISEKGEGPYRGFGYVSLISDHLDIATWNQRNFRNFATFYRVADTKTTIQMGLHAIFVRICPFKNRI